MNAYKYSKQRVIPLGEAQSIVRHQVAIECQSICKKYEISQDICWMYAIADEISHLGKRRAERIYKNYWQKREELQELVRADGEDRDIEDGLREMMMEKILLSHDIDVRKWYHKFGKERLEAVTTKGEEKDEASNDM